MCIIRKINKTYFSFKVISCIILSGLKFDIIFTLHKVLIGSKMHTLHRSLYTSIVASQVRLHIPSSDITITNK